MNLLERHWWIQLLQHELGPQFKVIVSQRQFVFKKLSHILYLVYYVSFDTLFDVFGFMLYGQCHVCRFLAIGGGGSQAVLYDIIMCVSHNFITSSDYAL